jgi:prepilin-type N-terminal cleavage/methylation domain-containing protein
MRTSITKTTQGFSLVEALAAVAIIGIVTFLALPNVVQLKTKGDENTAKARAEGFNFGVAAYVNSVGLARAAQEWSAADAAGRYSKVQPFLSFSEPTLTAYMPAGYKLDVAAYSISSTGVTALGKVPLINESANVTIQY